MNPTHSVTHEKISQRAHQIWEHEGKPDNSETAHWLQAEHELHQLRSRSDDLEGSRGSAVEPIPSAKHSAQKSPHSSPYAPSGVTTDSLHHRRNG